MFEVSAIGRDAHHQFTETNIIIGVLAFIWLEYLFELFLKFRQHFVFLRETKVPTELQDLLPQQYFDNSRSYNIEKSAFTIFKDFVVVLLKTIETALRSEYVKTSSEENNRRLFGQSVILSRSHAKMWNLSADVMKSFGLESDDCEILRSCVAVGISNLINSLTFTPFKMFEAFVLDRRYGLSKPTLFRFLKEQLKQAIVTVALIEPMVAGIVYIVQHGGPHFFLHLWVYTIVMVIIYLTVYPELIAPFFETSVPLPEGELLSRIRNLCWEMEFASPSVYVIEGSRKVNQSQVVVSGAFSHLRVDIDCNIIRGYQNADGSVEIKDKGLNSDMLIALIAHELAHRKLNHLVKKSAIVQASLLLEFYIFSHMYQYHVIYSAFGFTHDQPIIMGFLITLDILLAPYHVIGNVCMMALNRRYELEADIFTRDMGLGVFLRKAVINLTKDNLIFPVYDPLYSKWFDKNPPLRERIDKLRRDS